MHCASIRHNYRFLELLSFPKQFKETNPGEPYFKTFQRKKIELNFINDDMKIICKPTQEYVVARCLDYTLFSLIIFQQLRGLASLVFPRTAREKSILTPGNFSSKNLSWWNSGETVGFKIAFNSNPLQKKRNSSFWGAVWMLQKAIC